MKLKLHPEADAEMERAGIWYEEQREGLGVFFLSKIARQIEAAREAPEAWPLWPDAPRRDSPIRCAPIARLPYAIAFQAYADRVVVLAIAHTARRPFYWSERGAG